MTDYKKKDDFVVITASGGTPLDREHLEGKTLIFQRGFIPADPDLDASQHRDYELGLENRLKLGRLGKISLDYHPTRGEDTKPSFDHATIDENKLVVFVGLTNYQAFIGDLERRRTAPEKNQELQDLGIKNFGDRWAYLQQAVGAMGLVITSDDYVVIGTRDANAAEYGGYIDSAAGYTLFTKPSPENPNPVENPELLDPRKDVKRLIEREFGIEKKLISDPAIVGFFGHPNTGEFDISYLAHVNVDSSHFTEKIYPKTSARKLDSLITVKGFDLVQKILMGEWLAEKEFMYSTWGALLSLRESDFS